MRKSYLPNEDKKMENPLENNETSCPQDEVREPEHGKPLRVTPKKKKPHVETL